MTRAFASAFVWALLFAPEPRAHAMALRAATEEPREAARAAFDEGSRAFKAGDYAAAIAAFRRANELAPHDDTSFNLALALEMSGDVGAAWLLHRGLAANATSPTTRRESSQIMRRLERRIAVLTVRATPERRLCVDGAALYADETGAFVTATTGGSHTVAVDDAYLEVELELGRHHVLDLAPRGREPKRPRLVDGLVAGAALSGAAALGLGIGAVAVSDDQTKAALGATSVVAAAAATGFAIAGLVVHVRNERARTNAHRPEAAPEGTVWNCPDPGSP